MDHALTFFCLAPSNDADIEIVDDPAEHLRDVVASISSTYGEDPPSTEKVPNTIACLRIKFHGHSLVSQVRNLQATIVEREEELKESESKRNLLTAAFRRNLCDREARYMAEIGELIAAQEEEADKLQAEKNATQKELDEVKSNHAKLVEEYATAVKQHDIELSTAKQNIVMDESERDGQLDAERIALQRKVDELTTQNQELARAVATRFRQHQSEAARDLGSDDEGNVVNAATLENSLPPSSNKATPRHPETHHYSSFDPQLFSLNASSPSQVKRALEAHLLETERRLQEASKLGTALVQQQKELSDKLKEVGQQQDESEIGPDLRCKLIDLEKECNEIGRETARASLGPKSRLVSSDDGGQNTPSLDGRHPASLAVFSSQATSSPSKVSVPSRKQRNQPSSRVRDIEFATDISTSLLAQVRQLQALLAERDKFLRIANLEKSRVELEAQGFSQRVRALDESEQRYKDENWVLESKTHELISAAKEATIREDRLASNLNAVTIEKNNIQRELDELKQADGKLIEENAAAQKVYDFELPDTGDAERTALQRRVDELTTHNQELARAVATRFWQHQSEAVRVTGPDDEGNLMNEATLENPPPSSPSKATPRHGQLESEILKSSLHHSHRMIQNLKSSIHREKTEKIELKRMLQEARDELEQRWGDSNAPASATNVEGRNKMSFKKPPRPKILGAGRRGLTEIEIEEPDWEDHAVESSPARAASERYLNQKSDQFSWRTNAPLEEHAAHRDSYAACPSPS